MTLQLLDFKAKADLWGNIIEKVPVDETELERVIDTIYVVSAPA